MDEARLAWYCLVRGSNGRINVRILHSGTVIPEVMVCRILMFMWAFGPLILTAGTPERYLYTWARNVEDDVDPTERFRYTSFMSSLGIHSSSSKYSFALSCCGRQQPFTVLPKKTFEEHS